MYIVTVRTKGYKEGGGEEKKFFVDQYNIHLFLFVMCRSDYIEIMIISDGYGYLSLKELKYNFQGYISFGKLSGLNDYKEFEIAKY